MGKQVEIFENLFSCNFRNNKGLVKHANLCENFKNFYLWCDTNCATIMYDMLVLYMYCNCWRKGNENG